MTDKTLKDSKKKLESLRDEYKKLGVNGFLIPRTDEYQSEYLPESAERLAWLTGFTGSAGYAAILDDKAVAASDSRYTIQIKNQVDKTLYEIADSTDTPLLKWLESEAKDGYVIGYDPYLHTPSQIKQLEDTLSKKNISLLALDNNPLDVIWKNRPAAPSSRVRVFPEAIAGNSSGDKIADISKKVSDHNAKAVIINKADSVAWALNIRGDDIPHNPFALSYLIVHEDERVDWFIDPKRVSSSVRQHIGNNVQICEPSKIKDSIESLSKSALNDNKSVLLDFNGVPVWFKNQIESHGAKAKNLADPCVEPRAQKTPEEQKAIIDAHVKDGVALVKFLSWLDNDGPKGNETEITVADKLEAFRRADPTCESLSFDTIAGWNANGAIVHYRAEAGSEAKITGDGLLLVDSGGQYSIGGTTDVTRTVSIGKPSQDMKDAFTNVLIGHIRVAMQKFPPGTTGAQLDGIVRSALWNDGKNYGHGTGHGVGCNLAVHEPGVGIHARAGAFKPGMLVSNEPGFYKEGEFGIRIESLILVEETDKVVDDGSNKKSLMLQFNTVTLAPIDNRLINKEILTQFDKERKWLNDYHDRVYKTLSPHLDKPEAGWLKKACKPL
jgi:Xaa-Pro aminopeptidase